MAGTYPPRASEVRVKLTLLVVGFVKQRRDAEHFLIGAGGFKLRANFRPALAQTHF
jgi:hypothetical protein